MSGNRGTTPWTGYTFETSHVPYVCCRSDCVPTTSPNTEMNGFTLQRTARDHGIGRSKCSKYFQIFFYTEIEATPTLYARLRPSKPTLRPSNGRSVQIGSVQVDAPSVQWTLRPNQLRPSRGSVRPSRRSVRPRRSSVRPNHFFAPENSAPSVHRPWTDGALVWTERFGA